MGKGQRGGLGHTMRGASSGMGSPSSMMGLDRGMHQPMGMSGFVPNPGMMGQPMTMPFMPMSMGMSSPSQGMGISRATPDEPTFRQEPQRTQALPSYGGPSPEFTVIRNGNEGRDIGMDTPPSPQVLGGPSSPFANKVAQTRDKDNARTALLRLVGKDFR